ncbi:hypothetical protein HZC53_00965 [Candidatus Uhrbacteria bacterium]|nr:hypothetical protein [Candidatus Uhrbacteria bacterium]
MDQAKRTTETSDEDVDEGWDTASTEEAENQTEKIDIGERISGLTFAELDAQELSEWFGGKSLEDVAREDMIGQIALKAREAIENAGFATTDLDKLVELAAVEGPGEAIKKELADSVSGVGKKFAEILLTDKAYRESLKQTTEVLEGSLPGGGPKICEARSLRNLVAMHEIFRNESGEGSALRDVLGAMNLTRHTSDLKYIKNPDPILKVDTLSIDDETGDLMTTVDAKLHFDDPSGSGNQVFRNFELNETRVDGKSAREKIVHHESFVLADQLQGSGLAAELLNDSFTEYEKMGVDSVSLKANDTVGGYTWASSGFGFDKDKNAQLRLINKRISEAGKKKGTILSPGEMMGIRMDAQKEFESTPAEEKNELYKGFVKNLIDDAKTLFTAKLMQKDIDLDRPEVADILAEFDELIDESKTPDKLLTITPQDIALVGRGKFTLYSDEENNWYTKEELEEAEKNGLDRKKAGIRENHAGKLGLLGSGWYGKANRGAQFDTVRTKAKRSAEAARTKRTTKQ